MIDQIITFSIKNKMIIGLLTIALIVVGIWSMTKVPIDAVPDITNNQVQVITQAPNLGTEDIEQFVTYPVELAMANLPGVVELRSISRFGLSVVTVVFEDDMGTYLPRQLVDEKLTEVKEEIPAGFGEPFMGPISTGLGEIYQYTLKVDSAHRDKYSATDLRTIQDWIVARQMAMVPGVVEINAIGGNIKQYEVAVDPDELKAIGLSILDIYNALAANNQNVGGAYIEKNHQANFIRGEGLARNLKDIEDMVVKNINGIPITIKDVAKVKFGTAVRYGALTQDGVGEIVGGQVMMLKGANSNDVIVRVKERMAQIQKSLPEGIIIEPFLDRSKLIGRTTYTVSKNLIEGALIVIFVLVFLLGNWRGGIVVASTIPLALLFAFIMMNVFNVWANLMSLGAIDFGIIVDGAVIIVESTVFLLHQKLLKKQKITPEVRNEVAATASSQMMSAAFFGQLIILIVFIPILALQGVEGKMFKPMALTFMFAMMGVMILCLTYVPMMSAWFIRTVSDNKPSWGDRFVAWLEKIYEPILAGALKRSGLVLTLAVVLLSIAVFTFSRMGGEFVPQLDEGDIAFHAILKPGSSLSETIKTTTRIEKTVKDNFPEVQKIVSRIGVAEVPTDPMPFDFADIFVILAPREEWTSAETKDELVEKMKAKLEKIPGVNYEFTQPIEMRFNELLEGVREDIAIKLYGEDIEILAAKAQEVSKIIAGTQGIGDMRVEATTGLPQMTVIYNRHKLAQYGLNIRALNKVIQSAFAGGIAGVIFEGEKRFDLVVRLDEKHRQSIDNLKNLYVNLANGSQVPLKEVADISFRSGPMQISRDNTNRRIYVGINVRGRDIKSLVDEIQQKLDAELQLPPGYFIRYGGAFKNLERASKRLRLVVPIALGLIFLLIFLALKSFKQTAMIYVAIPLAAIGGVFSLWLRGMPFSISAGVGFIVLFGVAVLNGLVLISGWNELKASGVTDLGQRIRQGARRRIRPILLTALTDVLGFLPMAISTSAGAEVQRPLATVVIGGMITATLLTLFVLPVLYQWVERTGMKVPVPKSLSLLLLAGGLFLLPYGNLKAQTLDAQIPVSLEEAVLRAKTVYPIIKAARLEVQNQEALKKTAWDFGNTIISTGGEELGNGQGVYTLLGIRQQSVDLFGIKPRLQLQEARVALAEAALNLSELELEFQVKNSYGKLYAARQQYLLYQELDSVFSAFEKAARIRYETEATSRLEYLAAANQSRQVSIQKEQVYRDYLLALQQFNLWMVSDSVFTVSDDATRQWASPLDIAKDSLLRHPVLDLAWRELTVADRRIETAKAAFLPKFNLQLGTQRIDGVGGLFLYEAGVTVPLFRRKNKGLLQSARIEQQIAQQNLRQTQLELQNSYLNALESYYKWQNSWHYYESVALDLARKQRSAAATAYHEGAIDYVTFLQNVKDAMQIEISAWLTFEQYLNSRFQIEYFINQ
ncbi:MAG: CusA/CzcA family heavy metal efflux RND transporter [Saprospirales bacterium]|nr:CusA/CzcA family heavy metal efflux RND transporter [Saprospirales bacterium]